MFSRVYFHSNGEVKLRNLALTTAIVCGTAFNTFFASISKYKILKKLDLSIESVKDETMHPYFSSNDGNYFMRDRIFYSIGAGLPKY